MAKPLLVREMERTMTPKQRALALMLAGGGVTKTEAYRAAYGQRDKPKVPSLYVQASKAAANDKVRMMTDALREQWDRPELRDAASTRAYVMSRLVDMSEEADSDSVRMRGLELLGKASHVGLFVDRQEVVHRGVDGADLEVELAQRLDGVLQGLLMQPSATPNVGVTVDEAPAGPVIDLLPEPPEAAPEGPPADV